MRRVQYRTARAAGGVSAMTAQQQQQLEQATEARAQKHRARLHTQLQAAGPYKPVGSAGSSCAPPASEGVGRALAPNARARCALPQFRVAEHSDFTTIAE